MEAPGHCPARSMSLMEFRGADICHPPLRQVVQYPGHVGLDAQHCGEDAATENRQVKFNFNKLAANQD